ncbi:hypothetical protein H8356DRAFT_1418672 [Neocallimastix lanati (nom. inval.)]|nr:hypothetical protein H8356DRAFT_1418672 [Neocallimastix sp. JGI-2020a]
MQYDINKILNKIETENLGDIINAKKKNKLLSPFNIDVFDNLINFKANNVKSGCCFEISGSTCTGKTELLIHIISKILIDNLVIDNCSNSNLNHNSDNDSNNQTFVLNTNYEINFKSYCESVYYFDCDNRFNFYRLLKILKVQILKLLVNINDGQNSNNIGINIKELLNNENKYNIDIPIKMCLKYFNIIRPLNTFSLIVSLLKLKDIYPSLMYIIIDSISMFYYIDMEEEANRRNITEKKKIDALLPSTLLYRQLNKLLKLLTQKYKINLFLTTRYHKKDSYYNNNNNFNNNNNGNGNGNGSGNGNATINSNIENNGNQDIIMETPNQNLIYSLYYSSMKNNENCMEYFIGLQNNQLIFKNLIPDNLFYQEYSVYQDDLVNYKILISQHPENSLEIPYELNHIDGSNSNSNNNFLKTNKFICCLIKPIKSNILEFIINEYGIENTI